MAGQTYTSLFEGTYTGADRQERQKANCAGGTSGTCRARRCCRTSATTCSRSSRTWAAMTAVSRYMQDAVFIIPKPSLLVEAVGIIDEIYTEIERERQENGQTFHDTQGDLYEYLLSEISTAGKNGQFRTPRHIIQMIVRPGGPETGRRDLRPGLRHRRLPARRLPAHPDPPHQPRLRHADENGMERGLVGDQLTDERQWQRAPRADLPRLRLRHHHGAHRPDEPDAARHRQPEPRLHGHALEEVTTSATATMWCWRIRPSRAASTRATSTKTCGSRPPRRSCCS